MEFQVPQFIEVEDKIFGPLTFKQFIYVLGGVGTIYILYRELPLWAALLIGGPVAAFAAALAFAKVNERPFILAVENAIRYLFQRKLYVWKEPVLKPKMAEEKVAPNAAPGIAIPTIGQSKLRDIAWSLDILEKTEKK